MPPELNGIIVVDKPGGISSAGVVARVKGIFEAKKVGHTGTLDPLATGVLICCINRATRLSQFFLKGDKAYEAELVLGTVTDTQDATGTVIERHSLDGISAEQVRETAARFVGTLTQVPPVYSALKHQGTPLYKLARRGAAVEKPARPVRINHLAILDVKLPAVRFSVSCSSGTYVRTLCADMGRELGCGGHLKGLRRTASCGFSIDDAIGLEKLAEYRDRGGLGETVIPMNEALPFMPAAVADDALAKKIQNGMKLAAADFPVSPRVSDQGVFKVIDPRGRLIAVLAESQATGSYNYYCVFSV
ncbi:MAG: tRNA pseudouridine(55) synthase TruB [Desulfosarcina sp.]|nr:tRNA pseudouridine(55) synthase TruB [Desulfosarcina sp.]MBC2742567.1 tRNA pseudouridine(55) synthase TruB [Desulfosarcina sp.]MBC2765477.1 tRNA pseudouridine(55) synthase TruB [Desulfosarcina sp.]